MPRQRNVPEIGDCRTCEQHDISEFPKFDVEILLNDRTKWIADSIREHPIPGVTLVAPRAATREQVARVHSEQYIEAVATGRPKKLASSSSFPWSEGTWASELASCGGMIAACRTAIAEGIAGSLTCGAHHASRDRGRYHCVLNALAIAMWAIRSDGAENILYVDLDAHCGGGTHSLMQTASGYVQMDVSLFQTDQYQPSTPSTLDIVRSCNDYLATIERRLRAVQDNLTRFDLCVYYAGMDPHEESSFGGLPGVNSEVLVERDDMVFRHFRGAQIPCAFAIGGGYIGPNLLREGLTDLHRQTVESASRFLR